MKKVLALGLILMMLLGCMSVASAEEVKPVILVVSFGTSYNDNRELSIGAVAVSYTHLRAHETR